MAVELERGMEESPIHTRLQAEAVQDRAAQSRTCAEVIRSEIGFFSSGLLEEDRIALAMFLLEDTGLIAVPQAALGHLHPSEVG